MPTPQSGVCDRQFPRPAAYDPAATDDPARQPQQGGRKMRGIHVQHQRGPGRRAALVQPARRPLRPALPGRHAAASLARPARPARPASAARPRPGPDARPDFARHHHAGLDDGRGLVQPAGRAMRCRAPASVAGPRRAALRHRRCSGWRPANVTPQVLTPCRPRRNLAPPGCRGGGQV